MGQVVKTIGPEAGELNLVIEIGATYSRPMRWRRRNPDGSKGDPIDLTDYTALMQFRKTADSADILLDATEYIALGGAAGTIVLTIPGEVTADIDWEAAVYDLYLTSPADPPVTTRLLKGSAITSRRVSR